MPSRRSLRSRVAIAFAAFGALLGLLLCVGLWLVAHDLAQRLMDQTLRAEMEDYMTRRARNPHSLPPDAATLRGYVAGGMATDERIPPEVRDLPPGQHEVSLGGAPFRIAVADRDGDRYYILFSEERQKLREQRFLGYLVAGAALMTLLASVGGFWLAGRVIAPVTELARAVSEAPPENPPHLAVEGEPDDELADLAGAFDHYLARLAAFVERERAFAADASHELRTPLAVIRGAAEVLADDATLTGAQARRVARIRRATETMSDLIAGLLLLAREEAAQAEAPCDAVRIARDCVERHRPLAEGRGTTLGLDAAAPVGLSAPPAMFAIVVANLVHNAIVHTGNGAISVHLDAERLTVSDTGAGIRDEELGRVFDRHYRGAASRGAGIGLSLVKRICERCGWRIELSAREGGGTVATLHFSA